MRRHGRRRAPPATPASAAHPPETTPHAHSPPGAGPQTRVAHRDRCRRPVRQAHQQAALSADRPLPLHRERPPHKRMPRRDDHHLGGQRSTQLTQSVWFFVVWRKQSWGTQTDHGDRLVERLLTIRETCRLQGRRLHDYLTTAITAGLHSHPIPAPTPP
jgi:hypothetical protein